GVSISLFYVGSLGYINEWTSTDGLNWQKGLLDSHSVIPAKTSSLAATYALNYGLANPNVCQSCSPASLLFVYEDTKNNFQLCNRTGATDWTFSAIPTNPIAGSGVGLVAIKEDQYPYQLRLFYQTKTGNALVAADWVSGDQISGSGLSNASVGWNLNEKTALTQFDHGAMVSSFCFGLSGDDVQSYGAVSGLPYLVDVLTSGSTGVTAVAWFPNGDATYSTPYKPSVMDTVQNYSSIASHAWGSLYAMENGYLTEFVTAGDNNWNTKGQVITS
ncbi:hypothetical protein MMC19_000345, partial [Ptychographa xylographoides]|nr:hypothetical protein [Ptychographa xylographoides]